MAVIVPIVSEWNSRGLDRAMADIRRAEGPMGKLGAVTKALGPAFALAGAAAAGFAVKLAVDGVKAAAEEEAAVAKLSKTLSNLGLGGATSEVEKFIDAQARATGVADDQLRPAFDRLVRSTRDVGKAQQLLNLSLDVAAGTGKELSTVVEAIGKAASGSTTGLARLGAGIDAATLRSGDFEEITAKLSATFSGQAATSAKTLQGQFARLKVGADELVEAFGRGLIQEVGDTTEQTDSLTDAMKNLEPLVELLGQRVATTAGNVGTLASGLTRATGATADATDELNWFQKSIDYLINDFPLLWNGLRTASNLVGNLSGETDLADAATRSLTSATVQAALAAGKAAPSFENLSADVDAAGSSALTAAGSYLALWESIAGAMRAQTDMARTSGTVSSAIAAGAIAGPDGSTIYKWTQRFGEAAKAARGAGSAGSSAGDAIAAGGTKAERSVARLTDRLTAATERAKTLITEMREFGASISSSIMAGVDLGAAWEAQARGDAQSYVDAFAAQIASTKAFSTGLANLATGLGNAPGAKALINQIAGMGPEAGSQLLAGLSVETARGLAASLAEAQAAADAAGAGVAAIYYGEGVKAAQAQLQGMAEQLGKEEKKLREIGEQIGRPIGAAVKREITQAINEALATAGNRGAAGVPRDRAGSTTMNVTVQAGIGNPVAIAREVEAVLATRARRIGTP